jgi:hypothetical protein
VCQSFDLGPTTRHVVGVEAVYKESPAAEYVHHFLLYACSDSPDAENPYTYHNTGQATPCLQGAEDQGSGGLPELPYCHGQ